MSTSEDTLNDAYRNGINKSGHPVKTHFDHPVH